MFHGPFLRVESITAKPHARRLQFVARRLTAALRFVCRNSRRLRASATISQLGHQIVPCASVISKAPYRPLGNSSSRKTPPRGHQIISRKLCRRYPAPSFPPRLPQHFAFGRRLPSSTRFRCAHASFQFAAEIFFWQRQLMRRGVRAFNNLSSTFLPSAKLPGRIHIDR